jgi:hypothetical protein
MSTQEEFPSLAVLEVKPRVLHVLGKQEGVISSALFVNNITSEHTT